MAAPRPMFQTMWNNFSVIYDQGRSAGVGKRIAGKVQEHVELAAKDPKLGVANLYAIRLSYSLNHSGAPITKGTWKTLAGGDGKLYLYRISDLLNYLEQMFGKADKVVRNPKPGDFLGMKGILVFGVPWNDATGHVTLWNGRYCSDHCYFLSALEASIWLLK